MSDVCLSGICLSRTSGLSREQRDLGRLKLAEVAHVTRDLDTTFRSKGQLAGGGGILWRPPTQLVVLFIYYLQFLQRFVVLHNDVTVL